VRTGCAAPRIWPTAAAVGKGVADNGGFTAAELRAIDRDNALELLPRLKA
jgi:hypothetical protein